MPGPVFLEGDRITLRPIEEEDLEFLQARINDPRIWRHIGRTRPANREQERDFFENVVCDDETVTLLIAADGAPVGTIGFHTIEWETRKAELGYWVAPEQHRQGYGTDAVERIVAYGFDQLGFHRIAARVFECNEPSQRLLETVGFAQEGVHRDAEFIDGEYQDTYWYSLLEDEWRADDREQ
ncbi:GNAT family N-acetyltransferase [Natrinema salifodinae]|uniref:Protein N-acetyltransferase, RimJ/RimL family n=1 Tax=Natrinema salifodinae TaxID=1202768 RepID=A0A1I0Q7H3_9EURY|nr:GNAT family protein [Natrinema salifodinae]SEW22934.1 Protein N-acetyltransferase, RimJ/RimL family [Natrinema salifodinae]